MDRQTAENKPITITIASGNKNVKHIVGQLTGIRDPNNQNSSEGSTKPMRKIAEVDFSHTQQVTSKNQNEKLCTPLSSPSTSYPLSGLNIHKSSPKLNPTSSNADTTVEKSPIPLARPSSFIKNAQVSSDEPFRATTNTSTRTIKETSIDEHPLSSNRDAEQGINFNKNDAALKHVGTKSNLYPALTLQDESTSSLKPNTFTTRIKIDLNSQKQSTSPVSHKLKSPQPSAPTKNTVKHHITVISKSLEHVIKCIPHQTAAVFFHQVNKDDDSIRHHDAKWKDQTFTRTPFSSKNILKTHQGNVDKWEVINQSIISLIQDCLAVHSQPIHTLMRNTLSKYDVGVQSKTDFMILSHHDIAKCLATTIPLIAQHALKLPTLLAEPIPILKANQNKTIYLTKKLACSLLANAFFCTLPEEKEDMPTINFHSMFNTAARGDAKAEKLKCILNYFQQCGKPGQYPEKENRIISFERRCITKNVDWAKSGNQLIKVSVEPSKKIEEAYGSLQVDFANKKVGGGVLNEGAVMEEILFAVCPELIISRLFTENLEDNEVLVITGTEQFSSYGGYSRSFHFTGNSIPVNLAVDELGRSCNQVVVMDALHFRQHEVDSQFQENCINRELHKAFVAFSLPEGEPNIPVATGNWGCGAFNGDLALKFLIQWIAASEAGRNLMMYHTIGDKTQSQAIQSMVSLLQQKNITVGLLYKKIVGYQRKMAKYASIFDYIRK